MTPPRTRAPARPSDETEAHWLDQPLTPRVLIAMAVGAWLGNTLWKIAARFWGLA